MTYNSWTAYTEVRNFSTWMTKADEKDLRKFVIFRCCFTIEVEVESVFGWCTWNIKHVFKCTNRQLTPLWILTLKVQEHRNISAFCTYDLFCLSFVVKKLLVPYGSSLSISSPKFFFHGLSGSLLWLSSSVTTHGPLCLTINKKVIHLRNLSPSPFSFLFSQFPWAMMFSFDVVQKVVPVETSFRPQNVLKTLYWEILCHEAEHVALVSGSVWVWGYGHQFYLGVRSGYGHRFYLGVRSGYRHRFYLGVRSDCGRRFCLDVRSAWTRSEDEQFCWEGSSFKNAELEGQFWAGSRIFLKTGDKGLFFLELVLSHTGLGATREYHKEVCWGLSSLMSTFLIWKN